MARRKSAKAKRTTTRRRRVSGVSMNANSPVVQMGAIAAGYFLENTVKAQIDKMTGTMDPKIVAGGLAILGFVLRSKVKGTAAAVAGGLMMGAGIKRGIAAFTAPQLAPAVAGLPVVSGYRDMRAINGLPSAVRRIAGPVAQGQSKSVSVISGVGDNSNNSSYTDNSY